MIGLLAVPAALALVGLVVAPRFILRRDLAHSGSSEGLVGPLPDTTVTTVTTTDGADLHVVERGVGQPLLLVHGLALSHESWRYQLLDLAGRFRVIAVDLRGHGASTIGSDPVGPHVLARDLAAVIEHLDLYDVILVGHSLGGTVVGQLCADRPDLLGGRVQRLVFAGTFAAAISGEGRGRELFSRPLTKSTAAIAARRPSRDEPSDSAFAYAMARYPFGVRPRPEHVRLTQRIGAHSDPSLVAAATVANLDYDVRDELGEVDIPALIVRGSHDRLSTARSSEQLDRSLTDARVEVFDETGHLVMLEAREQFNALVTDFATNGGESLDERLPDTDKTGRHE